MKVSRVPLVVPVPQVGKSGVASPKIFWGAKCLILGE